MKRSLLVWLAAIGTLALTPAPSAAQIDISSVKGLPEQIQSIVTSINAAWSRIQALEARPTVPPPAEVKVDSQGRLFAGALTPSPLLIATLESATLTGTLNTTLLLTFNVQVIGFQCTICGPYPVEVFVSDLTRVRQTATEAIKATQTAAGNPDVSVVLIGL